MSITRTIATIALAASALTACQIETWQVVPAPLAADDEPAGRSHGCGADVAPQAPGPDHGPADDLKGPGAAEAPQAPGPEKGQGQP